MVHALQIDQATIPFSTLTHISDGAEIPLTSIKAGLSLRRATAAPDCTHIKANAPRKVNIMISCKSTAQEANKRSTNKSYVLG